MERRDFIKAAAITGTAAALDGCGKPENQLIRLIPEEDLTPGVAEWKPSICTMCPAGCGLLVKVVQADAEVVRDGKRGVMKMGLAKKLEGNPNHPINQGKLCPRGQAGLQVTYHPDRIRGPLKRTGPRGSGQFQEISWDEGIGILVERLNAIEAAKEHYRLRFLSRPLNGQRRELVNRFLQLFFNYAGPPIYFEPMDPQPLRLANAYSFGAAQLPTYDLANSVYVISFGADFLGTWNSPVAQAVGYGAMRQGKPGRRGKLVQVESRMSQTGANADEWIPAKPGTEGAVALGLAHVIISEKLRQPHDAHRAGELIAGWSDGLPNYSPQEVERITGVAAEKTERLAREMAAHPPAVVVLGDAALAQSNAFTTGLATNALNALLGSVEQPGGVYFTPRVPWSAAWDRGSDPLGNVALIDCLVYPLLHAKWDAAKVLLLYDADPIFAIPFNLRIREALERIPFIASFGSFIDNTSVLADLILPDHSPLESWVENIPQSGSLQGVISVTPPAMRPLHNTRAMPDVLLQMVPQLVGEFADEYRAEVPWKDFEAMLAAQYGDLYKMKGSFNAAGADQFWKSISEQGVWSTSEGIPRTERELATAPISQNPPKALEFVWRTDRTPSLEEYAAMMAPRIREIHLPEFDGDEKQFPFHFLPFRSQLLFDGSLAHLPWMQETPDPTSTAMWSSWVEINPKTAERLGIKQSDMVEVESQHGKLQAPALISPGIAPDVVAMPVGQGHENFTRYASGRGANPFSILAPMVVNETGSLAWAATRVKISRVGEGKLTLFAGGMRERSEEAERR